MIDITKGQLEFLKKFIVKYDNITIDEYLRQQWWEEDFEKEDMQELYMEYPELVYMISPFLMYRLQKFYNAERMCAGWCGCYPLSRIYNFAKDFEIEE